MLHLIEVHATLLAFPLTAILMFAGTLLGKPLWALICHLNGGSERPQR